jgi:hypothetical protein
MLRNVLWRMNEKLVRLERDASLTAQQSGELAANLRALAAEAHKLGSEIDFMAGRLSEESKGMSTQPGIDEERAKIRHEAGPEKITHQAEPEKIRHQAEREKIRHQAEPEKIRNEAEREKIRNEAERVQHKLVEPDYTLVKPDGKTLVNIKGRTQLTAEEALHWCKLVET